MGVVPTESASSRAHAVRAAVVYPEISHYRRAVFDELMRSESCDFVIFADHLPHDPTIPAIQPDSVDWPWRPLKNLWIGPFLWQRGAVWNALRGPFDVWIFSGSFLHLSTWVGALAARARGRRVLFWTHGFLAREVGLKGAIRRCFYRTAHGLLLYGHWAKSVAIEAGFDPKSLYVVYNSLDFEAHQRLRDSVTPERIAEVRRELFPNCDVPIVISSARLLPSRRYDLLFHAVALLNARGRAVNVVLVGDGPARASLERLARELKIEVAFLGAVYNEARLAELTMAAEVTVVPGSVGLTAIQSLTFGTPVVTHGTRDTQAPEWEAIIPGRTGDWFREGDAVDLAETIERWAVRSDRQSAYFACRSEIDRRWTPRAQRTAIEYAVAGLPADDLLVAARDGANAPE